MSKSLKIEYSLLCEIEDLINQMDEDPIAIQKYLIDITANKYISLKVPYDVFFDNSIYLLFDCMKEYQAHGMRISKEYKCLLKAYKGYVCYS